MGVATTEIPYARRRGAPRWLLGTGVIAAALAALAVVTVDEPLARALHPYRPLAVWDAGVDVLEWTIGFPLWRWLSTAVVMLGMVLAMAVPRWRHAAPAWTFVAATHLITKIAMGSAKDAFGRWRPHEWFAAIAHGKPADAATGGTFFRDAGSFPSGHVVLFASLALPILVALAPRRAAWWIALLAPIAFVMAARIGVEAHFVSDTLGGVALVALIAYALALAIRPCVATPPR